MLGSWTARREACVRDMSVIMRVVDIITCCKSLAPHHTMNPLSSKHRCGYLLAAILTQLISQCTHKSVTVAVIADSIHMPITVRRCPKRKSKPLPLSSKHHCHEELCSGTPLQYANFQMLQRAVNSCHLHGAVINNLDRYSQGPRSTQEPYGRTRSQR